ncbi:MAG: oxaloacetate decarboxylase subunit alpha [Eubacterium coprostanoligenes]|uniref:Oxaloacetate decarboxylase, alpha subunit n=1 Tax=Eubacterium coprostanoligenes TaxID=290054 RepID=A0A1T4LPA6_9FIRM|nr:oxaloacetate decarboxylase subunit alpha [Eubacterium coprostanoligenes]MCI6361732.1 oxaloacetate decarboxylase subunit alpha [Eubacterium coprostanoligenes]MDD6665206.1 oxaloacetate decarboxylase subunit alpha [Eubacterium coprostanoligenes]MDY4698034.1 oxaloacetate decarboxylase subunit alpha [Eubacterium coprostanoligenes]SJZ56294.1 oxaloacetate decarboxylase, alpha subunit [Eubacterium coprostanoligenes]
MAKIGITETVLRDAHQSLIATRMRTEEFVDILPQMDKIGYHSLECWGGATFDACLRFLDEDPWERLRTIRKKCPDTKLQMLFRGQNMLGYRHYSDEVVDYFVKKSIDNGIDILRIFDALNDVRNLETAINAANKYGGHVQAAISYTTGPVFDVDYYCHYAKQLENAGASSICIKDMAGLLTPYGTYDLVKALKETVNIPIQLHTHYTSGLASMVLLKGIEAGVDVIDTAMSPLAMGTSHPATESMVAALKGTEYDTELDLKALSEVRDFFAPLRQKYLDNGLLDPKMLGVDANTLLYQVPGGMLSNLNSQLKQAGKEDQLEEVLAEVPRVRKDAGYPPLVTPSSQIVGTQAVFNVIMGERYKMVTKEFKDLVAGKYGATPCKIDPEFQKKIVGDDEIITCRPADLLNDTIEQFKSEISEYYEQEEDVLSYAQFGQVAVKFFEKRRDKKYGLDGKHDNIETKVHPV